MDNANIKFKEEFKKRLYILTLELIKFIESLDASLVAKRLSDQLLRSGTSVIANYAEGLAGSSKKILLNF